MPTESQDKMYEAVSSALTAGEEGFRAMETRRGDDGRDRVVVGTPFLYLDGDLMTFLVEQRLRWAPGATA